MLLSEKHHDAKSTGFGVQLPLIMRLLDSIANLDSVSLEKLVEVQSKDDVTVEETLIHAKLATEREIAEAYANHYLVTFFDPADDERPVSPELSTLLPAKLCRDHWIVPIAANHEIIDLAVFSPDSLLLLDELTLLTGHEIRPMFATLSTIERMLAVVFEEGTWSPTSATSGADFQEVVEESEDDDDGASTDGEVVHLDQPPPPGRDGRIIRYVNQIFEQAVTLGASDIHIEPYEASCRVRLRVDGALTDVAAPPMSMLNAVIARIKVLSKMDIAEKRLPQDGAVALRTHDRRIDMRVSTCPTVYGEKIVMRVLDKDAIPLDLMALGMYFKQSEDLKTAIQAPHGLMLVTGPTGSGKSTTLYSCLNFLNSPDVNICTVEDPVEYKFVGINQVQTHASVGLNFASALRSFLRQDPDVIMVGEVRDGETAEICMRAALTGHFVLSTLHTNDALSAVMRLGDMGVEPFLLASTLRVVVAQRLIRRLCEHCCEQYQLDEQTAQRVGLPTGQVIFRPIGCKNCRETGYKGRVGVYEVIPIQHHFAEAIQRRAQLEELREVAVSQGIELLGQNALAKVCEGMTSLEEALSITVSEDH